MKPRVGRSSTGAPTPSRSRRRRSPWQECQGRLFAVAAGRTGAYHALLGVPADQSAPQAVRARYADARRHSPHGDRRHRQADRHRPRRHLALCCHYKKAGYSKWCVDVTPQLISIKFATQDLHIDETSDAGRACSISKSFHANSVMACWASRLERSA